IEPSGPHRVRVKFATLEFSIILARKDFRITEIGQRKEAVLNLLCDWVDPGAGNSVPGERSVASKRVTDNRARRQPGKVAAAPTLRSYGWIQQLPDYAPAIGFITGKKEALVFPMIEPGEVDRPPQ